MTEPRLDGSELVREARERAESLRLSVPYVGSNNDASLALDEAEEWEAMAEALEERERENERLREEVARLETGYWRVERKRCEMYEENERLRAILKERGRENERLREALEEKRMWLQATAATLFHERGRSVQASPDDND